MLANLRKLVKNHFVISFVPFGGNFDEFILLFVKELKEFEKNIYHATAGKIRRLVKITVFEEFNNLPNLHINFHFCFHIHTYTILKNIQVGIKETCNFEKTLLHNLYLKFCDYVT
ncbi:hypothetical protein RhiirA4_414346 [Rhizophagus irregularis]|uniref:Uncharacterized protein n=1 Tax=Rhizophagus irregularis TaxID=588596 RepID=A0A2I1FW68_9GLOM|nr:hypothetical protein RhiirA4_414346 [Rhizophagus irregularis]